MTGDQDSILASLGQAVIECDQKKAVELAKQAIAFGIDPLTAVEKGLAAGLKEVGNAFDQGDAFLPDLVMAGQAMKAGTAILEARLKEEPSPRPRDVRTMVIGTVRNDIHDIGKSLVALLVSCAGWNVIDLGTNVAPDKFIEAVKGNKATLVGLSSLLTTTAPEMERVIDALTVEKLRASVRVVVGGGAITADYAQRIGADAYGVDATDAVKKITELFSGETDSERRVAHD